MPVFFCGFIWIVCYNWICSGKIGVQIFKARVTYRAEIKKTKRTTKREEDMQMDKVIPVEVNANTSDFCKLRESFEFRFGYNGPQENLLWWLPRFI